ncbi:STAS domain-containing protein [Desulfatirhabdium butyrativorans]|uniref:STAS domain-containing protein n=1 Tax=Desulfatirhabdium butyrativorans TaxID=340467 RepID=UPI0003FA6261|nr:STAS domain-containing protein [Desulfatirhabdium butyrativorans]
MIEYAITEHPFGKRLSARGRIDALSSPEIQAALMALIMEGTRTVLIDLSGVNYISSAGLRLFISIQKQMQNVGGEILLTGLLPQVLDVFKMSGFDRFLTILSGMDEIDRRTKGTGDDVITPCHIQCNGFQMSFIENPVASGELFVVGSSAKLENAGYTEQDMIPFPISELWCGCGLAALGDSFEECSSLFGEAMAIHGNFFYYPAARHSSVDFLLNTHANPDVTGKFLHGFSFRGESRFFLYFQAETDTADLADLMHGFLELANTDLIGVNLLAESCGIWGMHLKKPPIAGRDSVPEESIFSCRLFPEWFHFSVEPAFTESIVAATGIAARDMATLSPNFGELFSDGQGFHLHGGIFDKIPIKHNPADFRSELNRVFAELNVHKIQHLFGRTRFVRGLAEITVLTDGNLFHERNTDE